MSMNSVYKYYAPTEYSLDALTQEYFWFSKRAALNDPYDLNMRVLDAFPSFKKELEELGVDFEEYYHQVDNFAICCFTTECDNKHFWSLYADSFKGWCLEFDSANLVDSSNGVPNVLHDVTYLDEYPELSKDTEIKVADLDSGAFTTMPIRGLLGTPKGKEKLYTFLLNIKNKEVWACEREKRLVLGHFYREVHHPNESVTGFSIPWKSKNLKRIIVGTKASGAHKHILQLLAKDKNVPLYEAVPIMENKSFKVDIKLVND